MTQLLEIGLCGYVVKLPREGAICHVGLEFGQKLRRPAIGPNDSEVKVSLIESSESLETLTQDVFYF